MIHDGIKLAWGADIFNQINKNLFCCKISRGFPVTLVPEYFFSWQATKHAFKKILAHELKLAIIH